MVDDATLTTGNVLDNGSLIFANYASQNPAFTISGSGSVTIQSVGLLTLSNSNSYSGGTLIRNKARSSLQPSMPLAPGR